MWDSVSLGTSSLAVSRTGSIFADHPLPLSLSSLYLLGHHMAESLQAKHLLSKTGIALSVFAEEAGLYPHPPACSIHTKTTLWYQKRINYSGMVSHTCNPLSLGS